MKNLPLILLMILGLAIAGWQLNVSIQEENFAMIGLLGIMTGAYLASFLWLRKEKTKKEQPDFLIKGENPHVVHTTATGYLFSGYVVVKNVTYLKYFLFGTRMYEVGLNQRKDLYRPGFDPINKSMDNDALSYGRAVHEAIFKRESTIEPTDKELEDQERYEELAERLKKRNNNNNQSI